jgi:hydrophobe/amphiphile efflux-1 (HAE1) family protein
MNLSEPFILRPRGTSLLACGILLLGVAAYYSLPIAPLPNVDFPTVSVNASLPGVDPLTAATSLAAPLEKRLGQIPGVLEMTSSSTLGGTSITVQFDLSRSIDSVAHDVQAAINAAAHDLPPNMPNPATYRKVNPAGAPVMILAMTSETVPLSEVYNLADGIIAQRLSQVSGVSQVLLAGGAKTAVRVEVDPVQLASLGMSLNDMQNFLTNANHFAPLGTIQGHGRTFNLQANDQLMNAVDYRSLVIAQTTNGIPIPLSSVSKVFNGTENTMQGGWVNGQRAVLMPIFKDPDANVIKIVERINAIMPQLRAWLPPGVHLTVVGDRTQTIRASVNDVQFTLMLTSALVILVMFLFLRKLGPTFVAGITVPLSLAGTFGVMWLCHYSLDNLSLMALTVSVGFLVDDAIVVIENIFRYLEEGLTPMESALLGAKQIGFTVISMSLSLIAVFLPILLMGGVIGRLFHEFAITLSSSIIVSAVISLSLTPSLCSRLLQKEEISSKDRAGAYLESVFSSCFDLYKNGLDWVLRHSVLTLVFWVLTIATTVGLYILVPKGFFPQQDTGLLTGISQASQDISYAAMEKKQKALGRIISKDPAVQYVISNIGSGGPGGSSSINNGRFFISLKPMSERHAGVDEIINRLRPKLAAVRGARVFLSPAQDLRMGGRIARAQYQYALRADNLEQLMKWTPKLVDYLRSYPQLADLNSDQQFQGLQVRVVVDRNLAGRLGIQPDQIDSVLNNAFGQNMVSNMYSTINQFHVVLVANPDLLEDPNYLNKIYVKSAAGKMIPLSSIARFEHTNMPLALNHQGQFPVVTFSFNLMPGVSLGEAEQIIEQAEKELNMPPTIKGGFAGNALLFKESFTSMPLLLLAAIFSVYIVLGILYESLIHPLTILSTIPTAGVGALLAMILAGMEFSIVGMIGIILLVGIVKKNAIMMVDFALELQRERGMTPRQAIYEACLVRFRPIMMTSAAAIFGSLPLAVGMGVGSELRQPLGVAIVGGLFVSQILTLFTTPVVYLAMERCRITFKRTFECISPRASEILGRFRKNAPPAVLPTS